MLLRKKIVYLSLITVLLLIIIVPVATFAKEMNVKDCLESGDCLEDDTNNEQLIENEAESNNNNTGSLAQSMVKMFIALFFVLLLIYVLVRLFNRKNRRMTQTNVIENLGGINVGTNKSVQIIRIGKDMYVIGVGESVELLKEITDQDVVQQLNEYSEQPNQVNEKFPALINKVRKRKDIEDENEDQTFNDLFKRELNEMKSRRQQVMNQREEKGDERE